MEPCPGTDDEPVNCLCIRIRRQTIVDCAVEDVCYRLPDQEENVAIFRQGEESSCLQVLFIVGNLIMAR